jgi:cysteine desulfurase
MPNTTTYLDYAASTPVDPEVVEAMLPYFTQIFGNSSAVHGWGQKAETAVEESRQTLSSILGCTSDEIVFTSCGSESDNLALRGVAYAARATRNAGHILVSPVDHHAVLHTAQDLAQNHGFEVELLPVDEYGRVSPSSLKAGIRENTAIVSIIYANNEIGTINNINELGEICRSYQIPFHTDAVQAASQLEVNVESLNVDLLSIGAHKFYGPKGVYPVQTGGSQEGGLRAGTPNTPLIVGMAKALQITAESRDEHNRKYTRQRDLLLSQIPKLIPDSKITGDPRLRLPNHASFVFQAIDGNQLLAALDLAGFGCSSGSACKTGDPTPSDVLTAIGLPDDWALGSLRVTLGRQTKDEDLERFLHVLPEIITRLRQVRV